MKKIISIILCGVFLLCNFVCVAWAVDSATVYSTATTAKAGEALRVPVCISNNNGLMGFRLNFSYDSSVLTPVSVEYGETVDSGLQDNIEGDSTPGNMCVYWSGTDDVSAEGVWFYINFDVNPQSKGETQIDVSFTQADTFNENFEDVVLNCSPIVLTIENDGYSLGAQFSLSSANFTAGESLYVYLKADEISATGTATFTIPFNSQVFEYVDFTQSGVKATVVATDGVLTVTVNNLSEQDAGNNILVFTFNSSSNTVSGDYQFTATATFNSQDAYCAPCTVTATGGDMSGTVIYADDFYALPGDTLKIPIYISNNTGIMGFRITFGYNPDILNLVSVKKGGILTSNTSTLTDSFTGVNTGSVDALWNHTENITENGELLVLTFTVSSTTSFATADISVDYTESDTFDENYSDVKLICNDIDGAITNLRPVSSQNTVIKPTSKYIYSEMNGCSDITKMLSTVGEKTLSGTANAYGFYGTGSTIAVKNSGTTIEAYTVVIVGDINGDSACDALDAEELSTVVSKNQALAHAELEAVDFNESDSVDITDYQSLVNYALSK